jgi:hypothetical protein
MTPRTLPSRPGKQPLDALVPPLSFLASIPEEELWLASPKSYRTRTEYGEGVAHFVKTVGASSHEDIRKVDRAAVIA